MLLQVERLQILDDKLHQILQIMFWSIFFGLIFKSFKIFLWNIWLNSFISSQMSKTRDNLAICFWNWNFIMLKISKYSCIWMLTVYIIPWAPEALALLYGSFLCQLMKLFSLHNFYYNIDWNINSFFYSQIESPINFSGMSFFWTYLLRFANFVADLDANCSVISFSWEQL